MASFDRSVLKTTDYGILGGALVAFIASFFPWFGVDVAGFKLGDLNVHGHTYTANGWNVGFLGWFPIIVALASAALLALEVFKVVELPELPVSRVFLVLAGSTVAALLVILKLAIGYHSTDRKFGLFLALVALVVQAGFAFLAFQASGEKFPWDKAASPSAPSTPPGSPEA